MPNSFWDLLARELMPKPDPEKERKWRDFQKEQAGQGDVYVGNTLDVLKGAIQGFMGMEPPEHNPQSNIERNSNLGVQTVLAGLPFLQIAKSLPRPGKFFHGTTRGWTKDPTAQFNPQAYDKNDVLGWMTHAAEQPGYADAYAEGLKGARGGHSPNVLAIQPEAANILDLINPNADDLSAVVANMEPWKRKEAIQLWKDARKDPTGAAQRLKPAHYPVTSHIPTDELPARLLADKVRLSKEEFDKTPFDAIRYHDVGNKSIAFREDVPLKSAVSGAPLYTPPKALVPPPQWKSPSTQRAVLNPPVPVPKEQVQRSLGMQKSKPIVLDPVDPGGSDWDLFEHPDPMKEDFSHLEGPAMPGWLDKDTPDWLQQKYSKALASTPDYNPMHDGMDITDLEDIQDNLLSYGYLLDDVKKLTPAQTVDLFDTVKWDMDKVLQSKKPVISHEDHAKFVDDLKEALKTVSNVDEDILF